VPRKKINRSCSARWNAEGSVALRLGDKEFAAELGPTWAAMMDGTHPEVVYLARGFIVADAVFMGANQYADALGICRQRFDQLVAEGVLTPDLLPKLGKKYAPRSARQLNTIFRLLSEGPQYWRSAGTRPWGFESRRPVSKSADRGGQSPRSQC
jgi:hypothetical protein